MNTAEYKLELVAEIELQEETAALRKVAASVIELPKDKQMDLQYFTAIYVSTGTNLNHAHFLGSELVAAEGTISSKALDVEHKEDEIIGHIYDCAFVDIAGNKLNSKELASMETASLDDKEMHVVIAGIIYKNRFPEIAEEVAANKWKVSMEAYYQDYDIKVGELIINRKDAESLGLTSERSDEAMGKVAKVLKQGKTVAEGTIARVLRNVCFSGCGIVKNPANPPSVILETAQKEEEDTLILEFDDEKSSSNNVTSLNIEDNTEVEESALEYKDTTGICVSYKKEVIDSTFKGVGTNVLHSDWCALYEKSCTSFSRDTTDSDCLRNKDVTKVANACIKKLIKQKADNDKRSDLMSKLQATIIKAENYL